MNGVGGGIRTRTVVLLRNWLCQLGYADVVGVPGAIRTPITALLKRMSLPIGLQEREWCQQEESDLRIVLTKDEVYH